jgi:hypothetical protein
LARGNELSQFLDLFQFFRKLSGERLFQALDGYGLIDAELLSSVWWTTVPGFCLLSSIVGR